MVRYVTISQLWFESMQNWQSEFIADAAIVGMSFVLRCGPWETDFRVYAVTARCGSRTWLRNVSSALASSREMCICEYQRPRRGGGDDACAGRRHPRREPRAIHDACSDMATR